MKLLRVKRYCSQRFGSSEKSARPMELSNETLSRRNCIGRQTRLFSQPKHSKVAVKTGLGGTRRRVKFVELFSAPSARYHFHRNFSINQCHVLDRPKISHAPRRPSFATFLSNAAPLTTRELGTRRILTLGTSLPSRISTQQFFSLVVPPCNCRNTLADDGVGRSRWEVGKLGNCWLEKWPDAKASFFVHRHTSHCLESCFVRWKNFFHRGRRGNWKKSDDESEKRLGLIGREVDSVTTLTSTRFMTLIPDDHALSAVS